MPIIKRQEKVNHDNGGLTEFVFCPAAAADHEALLQSALDERLALLLVQEQGLATVPAQLLV
jgi:hypothetical protein